MSRSHSFNSVHGRMPSVATGAMLANRSSIALGVSGDGDTASIGIGQFVHLMRRNMPHDLHHRGQRRVRPYQRTVLGHRRRRLEAEDRRDQRPSADRHLRAGHRAWRDFVGRSFSGDKKQLHNMLKAASRIDGTVMLDVISPCVTFNDHEGSTKSYKYHERPRRAAARRRLSCRTSRTSTWITTPEPRRTSRCTTARTALAQAGGRLRSDDKIGAIKRIMESTKRRKC